MIPIKCFDFTSSYPFCMLAYNEFPIERFSELSGTTYIPDILRQSKDYCFIFKLILVNVRLKDPHFPMPMLQHYKCIQCADPIVDNGRILQASYVSIYMNEIDLQIFDSIYKYDKHVIKDCYFASKGYLPRWYTDYVYKCFKDKQELKGGDPVLYSTAKARLNSLYGMSVQKPCKDEIVEDYDTGEFFNAEKSMDALYEKYVNNRNTILPYQWGVWVTSLAMRNLFELGSYFETWLYSDTDSVYGVNPDMNKINAYNRKCKRLLKKNGYDTVKVNGKEYCLGVATDDGESFTEFITLGAKRYAKRDDKGELHITIAGVPKKGAKCLKDDIHNFKRGFVFQGKETGKLTHEYVFVNDIYIDEKGNETGDSINLYPCDYLLDQTEFATIDDIAYEEVVIQTYGE